MFHSEEAGENVLKPIDRSPQSRQMRMAPKIAYKYSQLDPVNKAQTLLVVFGAYGVGDEELKTRLERLYRKSWHSGFWFTQRPMLYIALIGRPKFCKSVWGKPVRS